MRRFLGTCLAATILLATASVASAQWFAKGDYYSATPGGLWTEDAGNQLFDDGLHGDGAAGDGLYGGTVVSTEAAGRKEFKIATADWSVSYPGCNSWVHNTAPGTSVHFTFDTRTHNDGWLPTTNIIWNDHYAPAGTQFEVIGSAAETGAWASGVAASASGKDLWIKEVVVATPGSYEAKFRAVGTWDVCNVGNETNTPCGGNLAYTTTNPNTPVKFMFNTATGRARVVVNPNAVPGSSPVILLLLALGLAGVAAVFVLRRRTATA